MEGITMEEFLKSFHRDMKKLGRAMRFIILAALEETWRNERGIISQSKEEYFEDKLTEWVDLSLELNKK